MRRREARVGGGETRLAGDTPGRWAAVFLIVSGLFACSPAPTAQSTSPAVSPEPTPVEPEPAGDRPQRSLGDPVDSDALETTQAILDEPPPEATEPAFDVEVWAIRRGVEASLDVDRCELAKLGNRPDDVLWCFRQSDGDDGLSVGYRSLHVVRGKKLVEAFEAPVEAAMVRLEGEAQGKRLVALKVEVLDSQTVSLEDDPQHSCEDALAAEANFVGTAEQAKARIAMLRRVCAARGRYRFTGRALQRVGR